jgi:hypothetical protein
MGLIDESLQTSLLSYFTKIRYSHGFEIDGFRNQKKYIPV